MMTNYSLLPADKTFGRLFIPFFAPYMLYVGVETLPAAWLGPRPGKHPVERGRRGSYPRIQEPGKVQEEQQRPTHY